MNLFDALKTVEYDPRKILIWGDYSVQRTQDNLSVAIFRDRMSLNIATMSRFLIELECADFKEIGEVSKPEHISFKSGLKITQTDDKTIIEIPK